VFSYARSAPDLVRDRCASRSGPQPYLRGSICRFVRAVKAFPCIEQEASAYGMRTPRSVPAAAQKRVMYQLADITVHGLNANGPG